MIRALCEDHTHAWWRRSWYPEWCLIVGAYNHQGDMVSVHARAVSPKTTPKTRWPYGHTSKGTVFANRTGVRFLRGHIPQDGVVLVEGATDTLCATVRLRAMGKHAAVIGIHSGAISAFTQIHWPVGIHVRPWIDTDSAGRKYLEKIKKILKNRHVVLYKNKVNDRHG